VLERINGSPIGDLEALKARGTDLKKLADRGVETFFTQVFEHNFFHADMHPGNIFVDVTDPADPSYIAIDCAIIGSLTGVAVATFGILFLAFAAHATDNASANDAISPAAADAGVPR